MGEWRKGQVFSGLVSTGTLANKGPGILCKLFPSISFMVWYCPWRWNCVEPVKWGVFPKGWSGGVVDFSWQCSSLTPILGFQEGASHADHCRRHHDPDGQAEWRRTSGGVCYQPLWTLYPGEALCGDWTLSLMFSVGRDGSGQYRWISSHRFRCCSLTDKEWQGKGLDICLNSNKWWLLLQELM